MILFGGSTVAAARRAARLRCGFYPAIGEPAHARRYEEECRRVGFDAGFVSLPRGPGFVHVSEDPERDWARIAPHALYDAQTYAAWQTPDQLAGARRGTRRRSSGGAASTRVVTPGRGRRARAGGRAGPLPPLMGGLPPALG
jgi:hypothetical protein